MAFSVGWGIAGASTWYFYNNLAHNRASKGFLMYPLLFLASGYIFEGLKPQHFPTAVKTVGYTDATPYVPPSLLYKYLKSKGSTSGLKAAGAEDE